MSVQLELNRSTLNRVRIQLERFELPMPVFLSWKQAVEFNLAEDPQEILMLVHRGRDTFHEHQAIEAVGPRLFKVTWEIEWDRSAGRFHLLDVRIVEKLVEA